MHVIIVTLNLYCITIDDNVFAVFLSSRTRNLNFSETIQYLWQFCQVVKINVENS